MVRYYMNKLNAVEIIAYYANDGRLTGEPDGKRYEWGKMIERFKQLGRPLTDEEAEEFRIK